MSAENASTPGEAGGTEPQAVGDSSGSDPNASRGPGPENAFGGPADEESGARGLLKGAGIVAVALGLVQVSAYLLSVAGARLLPPRRCYRAALHMLLRVAQFCRGPLYPQVP